MLIYRDGDKHDGHDTYWNKQSCYDEDRDGSDDGAEVKHNQKKVQSTHNSNDEQPQIKRTAKSIIIT